MIRKFWWGYSGGSRKTHWVKWDRLYEAKEVGGMGFKEIKKFNNALLSKQVWWLINNPTSLCYRVFKARFFSDCSILEDREFVVGSYAWKSLLSARDVIHKRMIWRVGNGESMRIKGDRWLPNQACCFVISPLPDRKSVV